MNLTVLGHTQAGRGIAPPRLMPLWTLGDAKAAETANSDVGSVEPRLPVGRSSLARSAANAAARPHETSNRARCYEPPSRITQK